MVTESIHTDHFIEILRTGIPVVDIRSDLQYHRGHIPDARHLYFNLDLRSVKQQHPIELPKETLQNLWNGSQKFLEQWWHLKHPVILIYDQIGGLRMHYFLKLMQEASSGPMKVLTLKGGYESYLKWRSQILERKYRIAMLTGLTGSGKTELLRSLIQKKYQGIDLEQLAKHNGSAFGYQGSQPTNEQFQNLIAHQLDQFALDRWILVEQKGKFLGQVEIPKTLRIENATQRIFLEVAYVKRLKKVQNIYGQKTDNNLYEGLEKLKNRLDQALHARLFSLLKEGELKTFLELMMDYYDQTFLYQKGLSSRNLKLMGDDFEAQIEKILNSNEVPAG